MPPRHQLTPEQRAAVETMDPRIIIEAHPGSGKTTVAAERFGHVRFAVPRDRRRCLALSFTRSATSELRLRIRRRWGTRALQYPHVATTLDQFLLEVLQGLLRSGDIQWPDNHTELEVLDSWVGSGAEYINEGRSRAFVDLDRRTVVARSFRHVGQAVMGINGVRPLREHLRAGRCTHEDVRGVLIPALQDPQVRATIGSQIASRTRSIVVDEIFDGNAVDIGVLHAAVDAGVDVSVVGDPWQAVYQFRGAEPWSSLDRLLKAGFIRHEITGSFRFGAEMVELADLLRARKGVALQDGDARMCDVVLATEWRSLWGHQDVLPRSTGQVRTQWDAAHLVLLDAILRARFGESAVFSDEAYRKLGDDTATPDVLHGVALDWLGRSDASASGSELQASWKDALQDAGVAARLRRPSAGKRAEIEARIVQLVTMHGNVDLVVGMTVHQAKGGEWSTVGIVLSDVQALQLARGLDPDAENDRVLYVAITRARSQAVRVVP